MKPFQCICGRLGAALTGLAVCVAGNALAQEQAVPASETLQLLEQGPNHQTFQRVVAQTNAPGRVTFQTNKIVRLESGMQRRQLDGAWQAASDEIELVDGHAEARKGRHHVTFQADIAHPDGAVKVNSADGKQIRTRCLGLAYYDWHKRQSVLVAELKSAVGELGDRFVYYPEAFTDVAMDIRYRNTKAGVEQDVVILERLPNPELFQMNPNTVWVELWTEFLNAPEPVVTQKIRPRWTKSTVDTLIDFGDLKIGQGMAFNLGQDRNKTIPVSKHWIKSPDGRRFLVEEVRWNRLVPLLRELPERAQAKVEARPGSPVNRVAQTRQWPQIQTARAPSQKPMRMAQALPSKGLVLDYALLETSENMVLRGDTTYHIQGSVYLSGEAIIEGGTVVKYSPEAELHFNGDVICQTTPYLPAIFTAYDDNSVGETLPNSTGVPSGDYAWTALHLETGGDLKHLRVRHASRAFYAPEVSVVLREVQIGHCGRAIHADQSQVWPLNVLVHDVAYAFSGSWFTVVGQHLTLDQVGTLTEDWDYQYNWGCGTSQSSSQVYLRNSLVHGCASLGEVSLYPVYTEFVPSGTSGVFQTAGAGGHYLPEGSAYRDAGIEDGLDTFLLRDIRDGTTWAPLPLTNRVTADTVLTPVAERDTQDPDLGYHYAPLDYLADNCVVSNATLTLRDGLCLAPVNGPGLVLQGSARLISAGNATRHNHLARYQSVQELPLALGSTDHNLALPVKAVAAGGNTPTARFEFTEFAATHHSGWHLDLNGDTPLSSLEVRHSLFLGGMANFAGASSGVAVTLFNNVFDRVRVECRNTATLDAHHNLFQQGSLYLNRATGAGVWTLQDNAFSGSVLTNVSAASVTHSHNAYLNNAGRLQPTNATDVVVGGFWYFEAGPLGRYYQRATSNPLLNAGSRTAAAAGLAQFTVLANQSKDTNQVDLGFHDVARDGNGAPVDTDTDGLADYLEDADGDGDCDATESCLNDVDSDDDGINDYEEWLRGSNPRHGTTPDTGVLHLQVYTPIK